MSNLKLVLDRLREYNITCNPDKCRFGVESIEYVGHTIDPEGLTFSKEKLDQVLNFPLPKLIKEWL